LEYEKDININTDNVILPRPLFLPDDPIHPHYSKYRIEQSKYYDSNNWGGAMLLLEETFYVYSSSSLSIDEELSSEVTVYPNPLRAGSAIHLYGECDGSSYMLIDLNGREITQGFIPENLEIEIPNDSKAGIYSLILYSNQTIRTAQIVITD